MAEKCCKYSKQLKNLGSLRIYVFWPSIVPFYSLTFLWALTGVQKADIVIV